MSDNRKNIKVPESLFKRLKSDKGKHMNWQTYFEQECLSDDTDTVTLEATERKKIADEVAREIEQRSRS